MKRNHLIKFLTVIICTSMALSSCYSHATVPMDTSEDQPSETTPLLEQNDRSHYDKLLDSLPTNDFGGKSFRIATDHTDLIFSTNSESMTGKAYYFRNQAIEEKYNIKIVLTEESGLPSLCDRIKTEALAGSDYCDLILLESTQFQILASEGALSNVRSIPYLNLNSDSYFPRSLVATTIGDMTFGFSGDFIFRPEEVSAIFFNKELLNLTSLPNLYTLVEENQWDIENFLLYAEEIYSLGQKNENKVSGIISSKNQEELVKVFWAATGFDFLYNEYGERPELIYNHDDTMGFISAMKNHLFRSVTLDVDSTGGVSAFANGDSLFLIAPLGSASKISGHNVDWGILPIPKYNINQTAYYSYQEKSHMLAGFPKDTADPTLSGMITSALFSTSKGLNQSLANQLYLNLYFSSPEDAVMMQKIVENPYYDPAEFFGQIHPSYSASTQTLLYRAISTNTGFHALYNQYSKMLENYLNTIF